MSTRTPPNPVELAVPTAIKKEVDSHLKEAEKRAGRKWFGFVFASAVIFQLLFMDLILLGMAWWGWNLSETIIGIFVSGLFGTIAGLVGYSMKFYFEAYRLPRQGR